MSDLTHGLLRLAIALARLEERSRAACPPACQVEEERRRYDPDEDTEVMKPLALRLVTPTEATRA
ncbi:MAG: hypothetical protein P1V36_00080 [Planctomycetota bacterium]|nr:hypothetical protein [Planctomycetota bacterium]